MLRFAYNRRWPRAKSIVFKVHVMGMSSKPQISVFRMRRYFRALTPNSHVYIRGMVICSPYANTWVTMGSIRNNGPAHLHGTRAYSNRHLARLWLSVCTHTSIDHFFFWLYTTSAGIHKPCSVCAFTGSSFKKFRRQGRIPSVPMNWDRVFNPDTCYMRVINPVRYVPYTIRGGLFNSRAAPFLLNYGSVNNISVDDAMNVETDPPFDPFRLYIRRSHNLISWHLIRCYSI